MDAFRILTNAQAKASSSKRKSDATMKDLEDSDADYVEVSSKPPAAKKPRVSKGKGPATYPHAHAKELVQNILAAPGSFAVPLDEAMTRSQLVALAKYAAALQAGEAAGAEGTRIVKAKSEGEIEAMVAKLRKTIASQIRKQMVWRPVCKRGSAKWAYEGVCPDPVVFQRLMDLESPPTYKASKITSDKLHEILNDHLTTSIRYGSLRITSSEITVKWNKETGEFRFGGTYGM